MEEELFYKYVSNYTHFWKIIIIERMPRTVRSLTPYVYYSINVLLKIVYMSDYEEELIMSTG